MEHTNADADDEACVAVIRRYCVATKREVVDLALRSLVSEPSSDKEAQQMRGAGWEGDLGEMRGAATVLVDTSAWVESLRDTKSPTCIRA